MYFTPDWVNLSKRGGKDGVFQGLEGLLWGISQGEAREKSRGAALPARGNPVLPNSFYSYLHSISNTIFQSTKVSWRGNFFKCYFSSLLMTNCKFWHNFIFMNLLCKIFFYYFFFWRTHVEVVKKKALKNCDESWSKSCVGWDQLWTVIISKQLELLT